MSPLVCLQWALCCLPVMACEISIIIIMAPRAAMSADGRSLIGNELSHHPKGTCLLLCYLELYAYDFVSWHTCSLVSACAHSRVMVLRMEMGGFRKVPVPGTDEHREIGVWAATVDATSHNSSWSMTANTKCQMPPSSGCIALPSRNIIMASGVSMTHLHLPFETYHILHSGLRALQPVHLHLLPIILWMLGLVRFSESMSSLY